MHDTALTPSQPTPPYQHAPMQAEVNVPIGRVEYSGVRGGLFAARPGGGVGAKASRSRYAVLLRDAAAGTTLVNVEIFTGGS